MPHKEIQFRKKRELGEIFSDSFDFLRSEINPVFKLIVPYVLPFVLVYAVLVVYFQMKMMKIVDFVQLEEMLKNGNSLYLNVFLVTLFGVFVQSLLAGTYYTYIDFYIRKGRGNFTADEIQPELFKNTLLALAANLILFALALLGVILCILPGIYFANSLSIVVFTQLFEKKGLANTFSRSWRLVHSQWWNTFLINLVGVILIYAVGFVLSLPSVFAGITSTIFAGQNAAPVEYPLWYWLLNGLSIVISSLFWMVPYTFLAFQYFNLHISTASPVQEP